MKRAVAAGAVLGLVVLLPLVAVLAMGDPPPPAAPGPAALADIPPDLLAVYQRAAARCALPWEVLAAWGKTAAERLALAPSPAGGRVGLLGLLPAVWAAYGQGDVNQPPDAIAAAAGFLCDQGATDPTRLAGALAVLDPGADVPRILALAAIYRTPVPSPAPNAAAP